MYHEYILQKYTYITSTCLFCSKIVPLLDEIIQLEEIVYEANRIFLQEQIQYDGDATTCCVSDDKVFEKLPGLPIKFLHCNIDAKQC